MQVLEALDGATARLSREVRERADEAEALRTMPPDLVDVAKSAGLFRLAMPKFLGGLELDPLTIVSIVEELSRADGSAGWTVLIGNSTAFFAWLDPHVAQVMLGETTDIISTSMFAPMGRARRDGTDFVIDGRWPFNSGCMHAEWYQTGFMVMDGDAPAMRADGRPDMRFAYFPRHEAEIIDTWHSSGLRGTGSHDIEVHGLRVPEEHTAAPMLDPPVANGALWQLGFFPLLGVLMSGFPLGVARRALDELAALAPTKRRGAGTTVIADDPHVQYEIGRAEGALQSAKALVADALGGAWDTLTAGSALNPEQQARTGLAGQQAMNAAVTAVDIAFNFAGAGAVYTGHPLDRCFRDIHTANQHIAFSGEGFRGYARTRFRVDG
ncbi:MAG: indole-3-acetate monooxygenase [Actinomycetota bacterium]|nr:indole-3-acetate monooxygenase [Actinomycetota bacterium]